MIEAGNRTGFLSEALLSPPRARSVGEIHLFVANYLDGYLLTDGPILCKVNAAHAATAQ
jgi:hypothetical protein